MSFWDDEWGLRRPFPLSSFSPLFSHKQNPQPRIAAQGRAERGRNHGRRHGGLIHSKKRLGRRNSRGDRILVTQDMMLLIHGVEYFLRHAVRITGFGFFHDDVLHYSTTKERSPETHPCTNKTTRHVLVDVVERPRAPDRCLHGPEYHRPAIFFIIGGIIVAREFIHSCERKNARRDFLLASEEA